MQWRSSTVRWQLKLSVYMLSLASACAIVATVVIKQCACKQLSCGSQRPGRPRRVLTDVLPIATVLQEEHAGQRRSGLALSDRGAVLPLLNGPIYSSVDSLWRHPGPPSAAEAGKGCAQKHPFVLH